MRSNDTKLINPWKGLHFYTEADKDVFFGREKEVKSLIRLIGRECLTILFARSGMGKTSLLRAGVIPLLRQQDSLPVIIRIIPGQEAKLPCDQIIEEIQQAAVDHDVDIETLAESAGDSRETLWEYFHRHRFWGKRNDPIQPVVILDQFEEMFTLGRNSFRTTEFLEEIADLVENRVPSRLQAYLKTQEKRLLMNPRSHDYKIILSLREDFVSYLDRLQPNMPAVMRNRYCLEPLLWANAVDIVKQSGTPFVSQEVAERIVTLVSAEGMITEPKARLELSAGLEPKPSASTEVEPAYLSVMCFELFRSMEKRNQDQIDLQTVNEESGGILSNLYNRSFENIHPNARFFIEDRLLSESGYRLTLPVVEATKAGVSQSDLETLVNLRLLRFEHRLGTMHVEISHDLLLGVVVKSRTKRRQELEEERHRQEERAIRKKVLESRIQKVSLIGSSALLGGIALVWFGFYQPFTQLSKNYGKRFGVPFPIGRLDGYAQKHRDATYRITKQGWWGHIKKVEIINAKGDLTYQDTLGIDRLLSDNPIIGQSNYAYVEYAYDQDGNIMYEIARDRKNDVIWGLGYSPHGSSPNKREAKAIFLGRDGYPRPNNKQRVEYIQITYDQNGNEIKHRYQDLIGQWMPGPDNAYGRRMEYDHQGKLTKVTSLAKDGTAMNDEAGNASLTFKYNHHGDLIEAHALDEQGEPTNVKSGWHAAKFKVDRFGRMTEAAFFSVREKPVRETESFGAHLIKYEYDQAGNVVEYSHFDEDGKPTRAQGDDSLFPAHQLKLAYNALHQQILIRLYDTDLQPTQSKDGWHEQRLTYAEKGTLLASIRFFDHAKKPIAATSKDAHGEDYIRDSSGQIVQIRYRGVLGEAINIKNGGYHLVLIDYDKRGNMIRTRYFDTAYRAVPDQTDGAHDYRVAYDRFGNQLAVAYFDKNGKRIMNRSGYHSKLSRYNDSGKVEEEKWLDDKLKPTRGPEGVYMVNYDYDQKGLLVKKSHYSIPIVNPLVDSSGVAETLYSYNSKHQKNEGTILWITKSARRR